MGSQLEKVESIIVGGAWQQYPETTGHIVSIARKQREQAVSSVTPFSEILPPKASIVFQNGTTWQWVNYLNVP